MPGILQPLLGAAGIVFRPTETETGKGYLTPCLAPIQRRPMPPKALNSAAFCRAASTKPQPMPQQSLRIASSETQNYKVKGPHLHEKRAELARKLS